MSGDEIIPRNVNGTGVAVAEPGWPQAPADSSALAMVKKCSGRVLTGYFLMKNTLDYYRKTFTLPD